MKQLFTILFIAITFFANAQIAPRIEGQKCLGGEKHDEAFSIQQTLGGGYIIAGDTYSRSGDVKGNHGGWDSWVVKLNSSGDIQKQNCLGGSSNDFARSIQQTNDSGYIVAGYTYSNDGDVSGNHGGGDSWVVKLDPVGEIQWQKCLGGSGYDCAKSIQQTTDGGYIVAGHTGSNDGDVIGNHGDYDYWIVKLTAAGDIQWQKCLGGSGYDSSYSIQQTSNGGYIVAGFTNSNDQDVSGNRGMVDYWVVKLTPGGDIQWQKCLGGTNNEYARSIQQTTDGGYIVAGWTESNNGDVNGNHGENDFWVVKLTAAGDIQWQKCLGGSYDDWAASIQQTQDGGYIVTGGTWSNDGDVSGMNGTTDYWVVKLDTIGNIQWQKCLGGGDYDYPRSIQQTTGGRYVVVGNSQSYDGDVRGNHGYSDYWAVKLAADGNLISELPASSNNSVGLSLENSVIKISPNPVQVTLQLTGLSASKNYELKILNAAGSIVLIKKIEKSATCHLDVSRLTPGVYYLIAGDKQLKFLKQ